jgi:hypothetical protein
MDTVENFLLGSKFATCDKNGPVTLRKAVLCWQLKRQKEQKELGFWKFIMIMTMEDWANDRKQQLFESLLSWERRGLVAHHFGCLHCKI